MNNPELFDKDIAGGVPYPLVEKYSYTTFYPTSGLTDMSEYKTIRFNIRQDNLSLHWSNAMIQVHGQVVKKDDGLAYASGDNVALVHNFFPHLFQNIKISIGSVCVENINSPGMVSSLLYNVLYSRSKKKGDGLNFNWYPDISVEADPAKNPGFKVRQNYLIEQPKTKGHFNFLIPLTLLFGFAENFLALSAYPVEIDLVRGANYRAIHKDADAAVANIKIKEIKLIVPVVEASNTVLIDELKSLKNPSPYLYSFRQRHGLFSPISKDIFDFQITFTSDAFAERPQMILVGLQRGADQTKDGTYNHAIFTHEHVETMFIKLNNHQYPTNLVKSKFEEYDHGLFYQNQIDFRANYLQLPSRYTEGNHINPTLFNKICCIFAFDVSKGNWSLGGSSVVSSLHIHFAEKTKENLMAHIFWYSDRTLELYPDGKPLHIKRESDSYKNK